MEHDDRTRAANLRRLRTQTKQLPPASPLTQADIFKRPTFDPPSPINALEDLALTLATNLDTFLNLFESADCSSDIMFQARDLRASLACELARFIEIRTTAALTNALRDIRQHLGFYAR